MLVVAATERELALLDGLDTFCCGIGPVEAALQTARALEQHRPGAVVHVGIAGSRTLEPPELVLGSEAVYCDVIDPASTLPRVERAGPDAALLERARLALPNAHVLPIATCGKVGAGTGFDVEPGGVVVVHQGTPLQARNETGEEILFLAYGAPTRHGNAEFLDDVESV